MKLLKVINDRLGEALRTDLFYFRRSYFRARTIEQISNRLQEAKEIRHNLFEKYWNPWYAKAEELKGFWGVNSLGTKECIEASERGYSTHALDSDIDRRIKSTDPEDLPLLLADPSYKERLNLIKDLLRGDKTSYPFRQDLIDDHDKMDIRFKHVNQVIGLYQEFLKRYLERKHYTDSKYVKYRYYNEVLYVVTIGKYRYHYLCNREGAKLIDDVELLDIGPEERLGD